MEWEVKGARFATYFMVLPLKGCDEVLGIQWLLSLGSITWKFDLMVIHFSSKGIPCIIQGILPRDIKVMSKWQTAKWLLMVYREMDPYTLFMIIDDQLQVSTAILRDTPEELHLFLREFEDIY